MFFAKMIEALGNFFSAIATALLGKKHKKKIKIFGHGVSH
ncbi:hypothetical protein B4110_3328 [Parageobacillus toebii]|uniref:Uncharacterized protein n=1 Tax=Parageobacillus toebii TaxID=153151 RepID=A0A150N8H6_9BACL|nr:hypothetical protein B4110_3328 [Parageobacillus toebii]